jgi:hypothetical protein
MEARLVVLRETEDLLGALAHMQVTAVLVLLLKRKTGAFPVELAAAERQVQQALVVRVL